MLTKHNATRLSGGGNRYNVVYADVPYAQPP
jgi:hypothetical protein